MNILIVLTLLFSSGTTFVVLGISGQSEHGLTPGSRRGIRKITPVPH